MTALEKATIASQLEPQSFHLNLYIDGTSYHTYDSETGECFGTNTGTASCGCCIDTFDVEDKFSELSDMEQLEILLEVYDNFCRTKS